MIRKGYCAVLVPQLYIVCAWFYSSLYQGVTFDTCEGNVEFFGTIATVCGDNPGSAAVAGFKESSSAFQCCRQCLATKEQMTTKVSENQLCSQL